MANRECTTIDPASATSPLPLHEAFSWFAASVPHSAEKELVAQVFDVCAGARVVLEIVHKSQLDHSTCTTPMLNSNEVERLLLFTTASVGMLANSAWERIEQMNNNALAAENAARIEGGSK
jgi:hypothetical protein